MRHPVTRLSEHSSGYRGFVITRKSRGKRNPIARYGVMLGDQAFGQFDAQAQATQYIDELCEQRGEAMKGEYQSAPRIFLCAANEVIRMYNLRQQSSRRFAHSDCEIDIACDHMEDLTACAGYSGRGPAAVIRATAQLWRKTRRPPAYFEIPTEDRNHADDATA